jgi:signal transduction histidine kinase
VNLTILAKESIALLRRTEPERLIVVEVAEDLWLEGDSHLLRRVIDNLLGNAWKFTTRTEAPRIEVGKTAVAFFVRDNGAGFSMESAANLFQPFRRLHLEAEFPGTGIGLATVQTIIERHGGKVWAEGEVGRGATFYFVVPPQRPGDQGADR